MGKENIKSYLVSLIDSCLNNVMSHNIVKLAYDKARFAQKEEHNAIYMAERLSGN